MESLLFITEKRKGDIKVRKVADGSKQRTYDGYDKADESYPTVTTKSSFFAGVVDAREDWEVAVLDVANAFLHTHNYRGHSPIFFIFGKNPISKNLEIGQTIFDKILFVKSPFDRVSDRNDRNRKMPVIGIASPLPNIQLVHAPPRSLEDSKRNAGERMFSGGYRACP